jgi:hypothetical protein
MALTIIAPEMLVGSAIGEYLLATDSVSKLRGAKLEKWTKTHGFFALMEGFDVKHESEQYYRISGGGIIALKDRGILIFMVDEATINDKSKADILVKGIACLQSLWLVLECVTRASQRLPITPLELATTVFVGCTVVTYLSWMS